MVNIINSLNELNELIKNNKLVILDCYANWCGPCRMLAPVVEELSEEFTDISFNKVYVDSAMDIATTFNIQSIPLLLMFKDGKLVNQSLGFKSKSALEAIINAIK